MITPKKYAAAKDKEDKLRPLAERQNRNAGKVQNCPRCGRPAVKPRVHTNALSRYANIHVCDDCGNDEAIRDLRGEPLPLSQWAAFRPDFSLLPDGVEAKDGDGA